MSAKQKPLVIQGVFEFNILQEPGGNDVKKARCKQAGFFLYDSIKLIDFPNVVFFYECYIAFC